MILLYSSNHLVTVSRDAANTVPCDCNIRVWSFVTVPFFFFLNYTIFFECEMYSLQLYRNWKTWLQKTWQGFVKMAWSYYGYTAVFVKIVIIRMSLSNVNVQGWRSTYGCRCFCLLCYEKKKTEKHCVYLKFFELLFLLKLETELQSVAVFLLGWAQGAGREGGFILISTCR